jgi:hypothetical protein
MRLGTRAFAAGALLLGFAQAALGTVSIQFNVVHVSGNVYQYVYSITNSGTSTTPVRLFDILFDTSLYQESSLQILTPTPLHTQWSEQILSSLPAVPAAYDALSLTGGIPPGTTVTGFTVQFNWLGLGTPGDQPFQVFDPTTFAILQTGQTVNSVPVPAASTLSLSLAGVGLGISAALQLRNRRLTGF